MPGLKWVIKVISLIDPRMSLGMEAIDYTDRTCLIVVSPVVDYTYWRFRSIVLDSGSESIIFQENVYKKEDLR